MQNTLMTGLGRFIINVPPFLWEKQLYKAKDKFEQEFGYMSKEHRLVHHFVVSELAIHGKPLAPEYIAERLEMAVDVVIVLLDNLEKRKTYLYRNEDKNVVWAYPVTVEKTPHRVSFDSGEQLYAACAVDAIATPFVQGRLREKELSVVVNTECAHCSQPIEIEISSNLDFKVKSTGCEPMVFVPSVDLLKLKDDSIIDGF